MEGLLLVGFAHQLALVARRMDRLVGRQHDAGGVFRRDGRILSELGERRGDDALRYAFIGDAGDVIDAHPLAAFRHVKIFAAKLQAPGDAAGVSIGFVKHPVPFLVRPIPVRIGVFVQITADDGLWFVIFRHLYGLDAAGAADPGVEADEVDEIGTMQQKLRHDGVVVVLFGHMTVGAGLGFRLAHGVGEMRREGLAAEPARRDRRLLDVDAFAVDVGGREDQRRGRPDRRDHVALDGAVPAQLEHLIPHHLRVVGGVVAGLAAFIMVPFRLPVRLYRQVATGATGGP